MTSCYNSTCMYIYIYIRDSICKIGKPIICHPQNHENNEFCEPSANARFLEDLDTYITELWKIAICGYNKNRNSALRFPT